MPLLLDLKGKRYGRLIVKERAPNRNGRVWWVVECDCGQIKSVRRTSLTSGSTVSCGCYGKEVFTYAKHRRSKTKEYNSWAGIKQRCLNKNADSYRHYGGRGIGICDEWRDSFEAFYAHIGPAPSPTHSVDRVDNDGDYEPGNVRWATPLEQIHNQRPRTLRDKCQRGHNNWYVVHGRARRCRTCNSLARRRYVAKIKSGI